MHLQNETPAWRAHSQEGVGIITAVSPCTKNFLCNQTKILPRNPKPVSASCSGDMVKGVTAVSEDRNRQIELMQVFDAVVE